MSEEGKTAIDQKHAALKVQKIIDRRNLFGPHNIIDLGNPLGPHQETGKGGEFRVYENGRIYWSKKTGAHEVHGGILAYYLKLGGPNNKDLGLPITDEKVNKSVSGPSRPVSFFQRGAIYWVGGIGGVATFGPFYNGPAFTTDYPIADPIPVAKGLILNFGRFAEFSGPVTDGKIIKIWFDWPLLGKPEIIHPERSFPLPIKVLAPVGMWAKIQQKQPRLIQRIIEKVFLL